MASWACIFPGREPPGRQVYAPDKGDAETLARVFQNGFRRLDEGKPFLWRTREDGTPRAMLTGQYACINNDPHRPRGPPEALPVEN